MELQQYLTCGLLFIAICFSIAILISAVQSIVYAERREKREREQAARDKELYLLTKENLKQ